MTAIRFIAACGGYAALAFACLTAPQPLYADVQIETGSTVYVERLGPGPVRTLERAQILRRGDRLIYVLSWSRRSGSGGFTLTNPLPPTVAFESSAENGEEVSVDGGRTWGRIGELRINGALAVPSQITHVRWRIAAQNAARGSGRIAYSATVR